MVTQYYCICVFSESKSLRLQWSRLSYLWDLQLFQVSTAKSSVRMCFKGNGSCFVCKQAQVKLDIIYTDRFSANRSLKIWHNYFLVQLECSCSSRKYKSAILYTVYMYIPVTCYAIRNTDCCVVALLRCCPLPFQASVHSPYAKSWNNGMCTEMPASALV